MQRLFRRTCSLALGLGLAVALTGAARADEATDRARDLFKRAEMHFSLGEFQKARELYSAAYKAKQLPELLFNIGQAYWQLGDCKKVAFYYQQFLLRKAVGPAQREQIARLQRTCTPKKQPSRPLSQPVTRPSATTRPTTTPSSRIAASQPFSGTPDMPTGSPRLSRTWFWVGLGTTTALLTVGAITAVSAHSKNDQYLDPSTSIGRREELRSTGRALELTSWAMFGLGGAAAVGTVVAYWLSRPGEGAERRPASMPSVGAAPLAGGALVVWRGSY